MKHFIKTFLLSFLIFIILFGGIMYFGLKDYQNVKIINGKIDWNNDSNEEDAENIRDDLNILLLGVDTNNLKAGDSPRSDTIMVLRYDNVTGKTSILSIPRDTRSFIRGRKEAEKINHAHAYGGPELTAKAVKDLLGIELDYYVEVDYKVVAEFVDILGGVEIDVKQNMVYNDPYASPPLHINIKKGEQVLGGKKAVEFLRYRKGYANQDIGRIEAQQQFIKEAINQTLKPKNIFKLPQMVTTLYKYVNTDIPVEVGMSYILKVKNIDADTVEMATLPGDSKMINGLWYFIPDKEQSQELVTQLFFDQTIAQHE